MELSREKRVALPLKVKESLKADIKAVAEKEKCTTTEVSEAWLLVGKKEYEKNGK